MAIFVGRLSLSYGLALCLILGGQVHKSLAAEQDGKDISKPGQKEVLFEDKFERSDLGDQYEILNLDSNRFAVTGGKLVVVAAKPVKNRVLLQKSFPGDFVATVAVTMQVTAGNYASLDYWVDEENYLLVGIAGSGGRRQPFFTKVVGGENIDIVVRVPTLGNRSLEGYSEKAEAWYIQLRREGIKYTGQISVDGVRWTDLGAHVIVQKHGRIGVSAGSGGHVENAAEFDELVVQE